VGFAGPEMEGAKPCLNGSLFYLPALAAMIVIGLILSERKHKAAPWILWAAVIFAVSVTLRSLDLSLCDKVLIEGRKVGTHFAWHLLNALALFLLLRASLEAGPAATAQASLAPPSDRASADPVPVPAKQTPEPLSERVASTTEEAAKEDEEPEEKARDKPFFPA
jgi:hypothetical protein